MKSAIVILLLFSALISKEQDNYHNWFSYLSPRPGAKYVMPEQKISFRLNNKLTSEDLLHIKVSLKGSVSKGLDGILNLASDSITVIFTPSKSFSLNELVELTIQFPKTLNIPDFCTSFSITSMGPEQRKIILNELQEEENDLNKITSKKSSKNKNYLKVLNDSLPEGFPEITITDWSDPSEGYIFVSPMDYENNTYFQIILDNYATPVYYRNVLPFGAMDFKLQPNGYLTCFLSSASEFIVMNSYFDIIDTISGQNGYFANMHELRYYDNLHSFFLCYDPQIVDMSLVVPGGQTDATVTGLIIQELDENKEVVFQWRSWDHFLITDASNWVDLTAPTIDYVHGNSIEIVSESEIMLSSRNMNEVTKIDKNSGDILWRLNGENNMFEFIPPADSFCVQHSIRLMPDSLNISLFDNGGCWNPQYSSAVEYILDEENFTCTLLNRFQSDPDIFGPFMGNTQRLLNGHTINGWGKGIPSVTEFDSAGNILLQFSFPLLNYRAFKFDWQHNVFAADTDEIDFGYINYQDSAYATLTLTNNYTSDININRMLNHETVFTISNDLPILLPQGGTSEIQVKFKPETQETFNDLVTFCWEIHNDTLDQRIAVQVKLTGSAANISGIKNLESDNFKVYPSPFKNVLTIELKKEKIAEVIVFDLVGRIIFSKGNIRSKSIDQQFNLPKGVYFIKIKTLEENSYSTKVIKQ